MPSDWLVISRGDPRNDRDEPIVLCSPKCLLDYAQKLNGDVPSVPREMPATNMHRRFLLVNGETADITEGIKWSDGKVDVNYGSPHAAWKDWAQFKAGHEGSGIQWIDQEVSDATNS